MPQRAQYYNCGIKSHIKCKFKKSKPEGIIGLPKLSKILCYLIHLLLNSKFASQHRRVFFFFNYAWAPLKTNEIKISVEHLSFFKILQQF